MTDAQNTPQTEDQEIPFSITTQYVKDQSFENPSPFEAFFTQQEGQPNISVDIGVRSSKIKDGFFEVVLDVKTKGLTTQNKTLFIAELSYAAIVAMDEAKIPQDMLGRLLIIHTPTMLFPFARAILANMTREGGFPALTLNPIDFAALYQAQQEQAQAETKATA